MVTKKRLQEVVKLIKIVEPKCGVVFAIAEGNNLYLSPKRRLEESGLTKFWLADIDDIEDYAVPLSLANLQSVIKTAKAKSEIVFSEEAIIIDGVAFDIKEYKYVELDAELPLPEKVIRFFNGEQCRLLKQGLEKCLPCVSKDDTKLVLTGINLKVEGSKLKTTATNGCILTTFQAEFYLEDFEINLPVEMVKVLIILLDKVDYGEIIGLSLYYDEYQALFKVGENSVSFFSLYYTANYPMYESLIPSQFKYSPQLSVSKVRAEIVNQEIENNTKSITLEEGVEPIRLNTDYLKVGLDLLTDDEFLLHYNDSTSPAIIKVDDLTTFLIMPLEIRD